MLKSLIELSARALCDVEVDFAVDSTGFSTRSYVRWFDEKHGKMRKTTDWVKAHVRYCRRKYERRQHVEITGRNGSDSKQYMPLLKSTARHFDVKEVSADKALGRWTLRHTTQMGADPFIPFKENSKPNAHDGLWTRYYERFVNERKRFTRTTTSGQTLKAPSR